MVNQQDGTKEPVLAAVRANHRVAFRAVGLEVVSGDNARCPFPGHKHDDASPSLSIGGERGLWYCNVCDIGGDIFDFVMRRDKVSFPDALRIVGEAVGVPVNSNVPVGQLARRDDERSLEQLAKKADLRLGPRAKTAYQFLFSDDPRAKEAREYLHRERGLNDAILRECRIGYEPVDGRYTIPIRDERGRVVNLRRYIPHAPSNRDKMWSVKPFGRVRFWPIEEILEHDDLVMCEGEWDCMVLLQDGIHALTVTGGAKKWPRGEALVPSFQGKRVTICADNDDDGRRAGEVWSEKLLAAGASEVRIAELPAEVGRGGDVTDFRIRLGRSPEDLQRLIEAARPYRRRSASRRSNATGPESEQDGCTSYAQRCSEMLLEFYEVVGHSHTDRGPTLRLWSKRHRRFVDVDIASPRRARAELAIEVGDVAAWCKANGFAGKNGKPLLDVVPSAFEQLAGDTPAIDGATKTLGQGLHLPEPGMAVIVTGTRLFFKPEPGTPWREADSPLFAEGYVAQPGADDWLPWELNELNRPLKYTPGEAVELLHEGLGCSWAWQHDGDPLLHALLLSTFNLQDAFPRKPLVHIRGPTTSGKSRLALGIYGGREWLEMGGPFVIHAAVEISASAAGLYAKYANAARLLVFDEGELSEQRHHARDILSLLRGSTGGGSGRLRGTPSLGYRQQTLNLPAIWSSIELVGQSDADATRWIVTELSHDDKWPDPALLLAERWKIKEVDPGELRRTLALGLVDEVPALVAAFDELRRAVDLPNAALLDSRYRETLCPALAVAKVCGRDVGRDAGQFFADKAGHHQFERVHRKPMRLLDQLLNGRMRLDTGKETTLSVLIGAQEGCLAPNNVEHPEAGVAVLWGRCDPILYVSWEAAKQSMLRGSEFEHESPKALTLLATQIPGFAGNAIRKRIGGANPRWTVIRLKEAPAAQDNRERGNR